MITIAVHLTREEAEALQRYLRRITESDIDAIVGRDQVRPFESASDKVRVALFMALEK